MGRKQRGIIVIILMARRGLHVRRGRVSILVGMGHVDIWDESGEKAFIGGCLGLWMGALWCF